MNDARNGPVVFAPKAQPEPVAIAGRYLRDAFPAVDSETLAWEVARLLIHLSHQPYRQGQ